MGRAYSLFFPGEGRQTKQAPLPGSPSYRNIARLNPHNRSHRRKHIYLLYAPSTAGRFYYMGYFLGIPGLFGHIRENYDGLPLVPHAQESRRRGVQIDLYI